MLHNTACTSWITAYGKYAWTADLSDYRWAHRFPGYFNRTITPENTRAFEDRLRQSLDYADLFPVAGEVCFWKNYGSIQSRDRLTTKLLEYLQSPKNWKTWAQAVRQLADEPSYRRFKQLQKACSQPSGFATPITFLAFYRPTQYPMVDKHIAYWWRQNRARYGYVDKPDFSQRSDGWIRPVQRSWNAYVSWALFCRDYGRRASERCRLDWRARDVEMAIWEARKRRLPLEVLQES